ncbi:LAXTG-anchored chaplin ChpB [Streptomyces anthocyanicus]|uniref:LAXTG-anchored chaplin ChpB n=1 Tax=Streptomyces anthocyanicus TaxID=68174 RepID=UPI002243EB6A|nr:LAXTG-anchored chaplin ChpB [Streptomyces anthocyanicus]MCW8120441.1 LAXTG-anchored chaplin ChpB [Streptomyces anthocyanicus]
MRRVTRNGVLAVAASGALAVTMPAYAAFASDGAGAEGSAAGSPGLISGNTVQLPVDVPVDVCGNTVNVVGLLNPAAGNGCADSGEPGASYQAAGASGGTSGSATEATSGGAAAEGSGKDSPGVLSGNGVQLRVHLPVNVSGNSVNVVGIGNPAVGNESTNDSGDHPEPVRPPAEPEPSAPEEERAGPGPSAHAAPPREEVSLAHTGTDRTLPTLAGGAALVLGGTVLYRRFRPGSGD